MSVDPTQRNRRWYVFSSFSFWEVTAGTGRTPTATVIPTTTTTSPVVAVAVEVTAAAVTATPTGDYPSALCTPADNHHSTLAPSRLHQCLSFRGVAATLTPNALTPTPTKIGSIVVPQRDDRQVSSVHRILLPSTVAPNGNTLLPINYCYHRYYDNTNDDNDDGDDNFAQR